MRTSSIAANVRLLAVLAACGLWISWGGLCAAERPVARAVAPGIVSAEKVDPKKAKASPDGSILWYDCRELAVEGKGWTDTASYYDRLPARAEGKVPPSVWYLSHCSAGLCVRFTTDAPSLEVRWTVASRNLAMPHMPADGVSGVDLYAKDKSGRWRFVGNGQPVAVSNTASFTPPPGSPCLVYLPLYNGVTFDRNRHSKGPDTFHARRLRPQAAQVRGILRHLHYSGRLCIAAGHGRHGDRGPATGCGGDQLGLQRQWEDGAGNGGLARRTRSVRLCPRLLVEHVAGGSLHASGAVRQAASLGASERVYCSCRRLERPERVPHGERTPLASGLQESGGGRDNEPPFRLEPGHVG